MSDPSLQALLRGLGEGNPGLCVVTTREAVPDLVAMSEPRRVTVDLNTLEPADGAKLLSLYGVKGSDDALQQASRDYEGHSLALILLGTYLRDRFGGDIVQRNRVTWPPGTNEDEMPALDTAELTKAAPNFAKHARKVMASYVSWFEHEPEHDDLSAEDPVIARAAVSILRLMGLFNRPADFGCLNALRAEPPIPGLTEPLFASEDREELWRQAVIRLRQAHLLADDSSIPQSAIANPQSLDAHPLVREHFAAQLAAQLPDAAREAHRRLYEHLKQSAPELPDNLNDMMPLYHAVAHGCKAELWSECYDFYLRHIRRGHEFFSTKKLGAFGADLSALSCFFERVWQEPSNSLHPTIRALLFGNVAIRLRALNRIREAADLQARAVAEYVRQDMKNDSAAGALNLSELSLMLGDVSSAVRQGEQSVELADSSGDAFFRMATRTTLAGALHASGRRWGFQPVPQTGAGTPSHRAALAAFREAEAMQKELHPQYRLLYSLWGYKYCDLLLETDVPGPDWAKYWRA